MNNSSYLYLQGEEYLFLVYYLCMYGCLYVYICMHVCSYVYICMYTHRCPCTCVCICVETKKDNKCLPQSLSTLYIKAEFLPYSVSLTSQLALGIPSLSPQAGGLPLPPCVYIGLGIQLSNLHSKYFIYLSTELSSQPLKNFEK